MVIQSLHEDQHIDGGTTLLATVTFIAEGGGGVSQYSNRPMVVEILVDILQQKLCGKTKFVVVDTVVYIAVFERQLKGEN